MNTQQQLESKWEALSNEWKKTHFEPSDTFKQRFIQLGCEIEASLPGYESIDWLARWQSMCAAFTIVDVLDAYGVDVESVSVGGLR